MPEFNRVTGSGDGTRSTTSGGVDNIRRHFSRDVARKAVKRLMALTNGGSIRAAA